MVAVGPTLLGANVHVEEGAWLVRGVAAANASIARGSCVTDRMIASQGGPAPRSHLLDRTANDQAERRKTRGPAKTDRPNPADPRLRGSQRAWLAAWAVVGAFVWAFWHTLADLWRVWQDSGDYSAGMLVAPAAVYMVLTQRAKLQSLSPHPALWLGACMIAVGATLHLMGTLYLYRSAENVGMLLCAHGLVLGLLGMAGYRLVWYPMAFLTLMLPLPVRIHDAVMLRLQDVGAQCAGAVLELIGVPVVRQGNVLEVAQQSVAVAEACSGLRMALAFLIVCCVLAYVLRRPNWQKLAIVVSSIPIAIACNVFRIVSAAYLYNAGYDRLAEGVFHDTAGLLMVPVAMALLFIELRLLSNLALSRDAIVMLAGGANRERVAPNRS